MISMMVLVFDLTDTNKDDHPVLVSHILSSMAHCLSPVATSLAALFHTYWVVWLTAYHQWPLHWRHCSTHTEQYGSLHITSGHFIGGIVPHILSSMAHCISPVATSLTALFHTYWAVWLTAYHQWPLHWWHCSTHTEQYGSLHITSGHFIGGIVPHILSSKAHWLSPVATSLVALFHTYWAVWLTAYHQWPLHWRHCSTHTEQYGSLLITSGHFIGGIVPHILSSVAHCLSPVATSLAVLFHTYWAVWLTAYHQWPLHWRHCSTHTEQYGSLLITSGHFIGGIVPHILSSMAHCLSPVTTSLAALFHTYWAVWLTAYHQWPLHWRHCSTHTEQYGSLLITSGHFIGGIVPHILSSMAHCLSPVATSLAALLHTHWAVWLTAYHQWPLHWRHCSTQTEQYGSLLITSGHFIGGIVPHKLSSMVHCLSPVTTSLAALFHTNWAVWLTAYHQWPLHWRHCSTHTEQYGSLLITSDHFIGGIVPHKLSSMAHCLSPVATSLAALFHTYWAVWLTAYHQWPLHWRHCSTHTEQYGSLLITSDHFIGGIVPHILSSMAHCLSPVATSLVALFHTYWTVWFTAYHQWPLHWRHCSTHTEQYGSLHITNGHFIGGIVPHKLSSMVHCLSPVTTSLAALFHTNWAVWLTAYHQWPLHWRHCSTHTEQYGSLLITSDHFIGGIVPHKLSSMAHCLSPVATSLAALFHTYWAVWLTACHQWPLHWRHCSTQTEQYGSLLITSGHFIGGIVPHILNSMVHCLSPVTTSLAALFHTYWAVWLTAYHQWPLHWRHCSTHTEQYGSLLVTSDHFIDGIVPHILSSMAHSLSPVATSLAALFHTYWAVWLTAYHQWPLHWRHCSTHTEQYGSLLITSGHFIGGIVPHILSSMAHCLSPVTSSLVALLQMLCMWSPI